MVQPVMAICSSGEEFKAGIEYRFLVTYDTRNEIGKIEKIEHFPEFIRLDAEKVVPTGMTNANPGLAPP